LILASCRDKASVATVRTPFDSADSLRIEGRSAAAGARYRALADSFARAGDSASLWRAELWLGDALLKQGKRDSADVEMAHAVSLAGSVSKRLGWTRYEHSIFLDRLGKFDSAFVEANAARQLAIETRDQPLLASSYSAIGRINSLSGRYHEALASNQRAIAVERAYGAEPRVISKEMNELGIDYKHLGRFTDAVAIYDSALVLARQIGNPESIARVEFNLGEIRRITGDVDDALALFTDALARAEQIGEVRGMAFIHGGLAEIFMGAGAFKQARDHLTHALEINRGAKLKYGQIQNLEGLGRIEIIEGHPVAADTVLHSALELADSGGYGKERSTVRSALARAAAARGNGSAARRWADAAVRIADSLGDPEPEAEALTARGVALESSNDGLTTKAYVDAIDLLESWRGRLALGDLRMGVADSHLEAYEGAIRALIRNGRNDDALLVAERARARLLLELMSERDSRGLDRSPESALRQQLREKFAARVDASGKDTLALDKDIAGLTSRLDAIESSARSRDAKAGVRYPVPASPSDLRIGLLSPNRALLVFFWGEHSVYGWWVTRDAIRAARLGSSDSLATTVDFLRGALAAPGPDWRPASLRAYHQFVGPLTPGATDEVLVVADGPLATIPVETFLRTPGASPWGADTRFVYGPSASVLLALARSQTGNRWDREALAIGNPGSVVLSNDQASRGTTNETELPSLPGAGNEARSVVQLLGGDALVGSDATLEKWLSLDPSRYRYLHFATHALLNDKHPDRTSLILAHGRLDLAEIRRLRLSSELVTLSACETGLGQRLRGEGTIGLPHAFLAAGAKSVIVSLWKVEDRATAQYMADFYAKVHAGVSPEDAMLSVRQARIKAKGPNSHPSSWAPFILVGSSH
jgi:CHAT domain-containing protein/tetratricopeptide (TPR) repeat protein